ncbi:MAG: type II secretion system F family protein [Longibaculum sp.]
MKLNFEEKYLFCNQMAMILNSGFHFEQGVEMIGEETENGHIKEATSKILTFLQEDSRLSYAVEKTDDFDHYMVHLLQAGEVSGNLDDVMKSLSHYYLRMNEMQNQFQQALTYPMILLLMMFVVIGVIVFQVLPIFRQVLESLGGELTSYAYTFMQLGQVFSIVGFIALAIVTLFILGIYIYSRVFHVSLMYQFVQKSFFTRSLAKSMNQAQLTYALSLFIESGYDFQEALKYAMKVINDKHLYKQLEECCLDLQNDMSFVDALKKNKIYQGMALNMLQVGFKTGQADQIMKTLAIHYQDAVSDAIDRFLNIIEPTLVTFLSVVVGIVLLSVMLPLMSIMGSL